MRSPTILHDVISAKYLGEYRIEIVFDDGKSGVIDFASYLTRGGIFQRFRWNHESDIAPETLYAEATGAPLPEWMTPEQVTA